MPGIRCRLLVFRSTEPQSLAACKLLKKVLQSIVQDFCVVDVLGCLKGTRALTPCTAPRPTQDPKPLTLIPKPLNPKVYSLIKGSWDLWLSLYPVGVSVPHHRGSGWLPIVFLRTPKWTPKTRFRVLGFLGFRVLGFRVLVF